MSEDLFYINLLNERKLLKQMDDMPDAVRAVLLERVKTWTERLRTLVIDNINARLSKHANPKKYSASSRHLVDSVEVEIINEGLRIEGRVYISGIPYAHIQESGGRTSAHVIRPRDAKILAFMAATGDKVFALHVFHPGSTIVGKHFMRDAYREMSPKVTSGLYYQLVRKIKGRR